MLLVLIPCPVSAATGVLEITVRDANTHYSLQANIGLEGPQRLSVQTDDIGRLRLTLAPGEYRIEISASGHKLMRTHYKIGPGKNLPFTIMLDPESLPEEERPGVIDAQIRPGFTLFHGYTVDSETGKPLSGVKVRFVHAGVETQTDSKGHFCLSVPTPQPEYSGGFGTDTLVYEKPGYKSLIINNFGITDDEMGGVAVDLEIGKGETNRDTHPLMRNNANTVEPTPPVQSPVQTRSNDLCAWPDCLESGFRRVLAPSL